MAKKILVATDAWYPHICGVVRSLEATTRAAKTLGYEFEFVTPDLFRTVPLPYYPDIPLSLVGLKKLDTLVNRFQPDGIHIATEGPIGWQARRWCLLNGRKFTTSFTTRFPEYIRARVPIPVSWSYAVLRRFHSRAGATMVSAPSLMRDLEVRGFSNLVFWTRGVDAKLFTPERAQLSDLPRPIFVSVGRVAVEKNLEAFLSLDLPGSKVVIGEGPDRSALMKKYPAAHFPGLLEGEALATRIASSDVFVFPSRTDTYGVVQLEALACGVPVAAYPVPGPQDVIRDPSVGILDEDLRQACLSALDLNRDDCRAYALTKSWANCAKEFTDTISKYAFSEIDIEITEPGPKEEAADDEGIRQMSGHPDARRSDIV